MSLTADRGELLALCGPEGSGTRTLLHLLSGHLLPDVGRVRVDGRGRGTRPAPGVARSACGSPPAPTESTALLAAPGAASILLLERPTAGLERGRRRTRCSPPPGAAADAGAAVVLAVDAPEPVAASRDDGGVVRGRAAPELGRADGRARCRRCTSSALAARWMPLRPAPS